MHTVCNIKIRYHHLNCISTSKTSLVFLQDVLQDLTCIHKFRMRISPIILPRNTPSGIYLKFFLEILPGMSLKITSEMPAKIPPEIRAANRLTILAGNYAADFLLGVLLEISCRDSSKYLSRGISASNLPTISASFLPGFFRGFL